MSADAALRRRASGARLVTAAAALVAAALIAACTGGDGDGDGGREGRSTSSSSSTTLQDFSRVSLAPVAGSTTTTIREKGEAALEGTVTGPDGEVVFRATVRVERLVNGRILTTDTSTGPMGRWQLRDVPGGRYRVRAFKAPELAQVEATLLFATDGEVHRVDLELEPFNGIVAVPSVAPDPPLLGRSVNLVVQIETRSVDAQGVARASPVTGVTVELLPSAKWRLESDPITVTGPRGRVEYALVCEVTGPPRLFVRVAGGDLVALQVPNCVARRGGSTTSTTTGASVTTTTVATTTSTTTDDTTSTTQGDGRGPR